MKKFLLLYMAPVSAEEQMKNTNPEDGKKMMEVWTKWYEKAGPAIVDGGMPTQKVATVGNANGNSEGFIGGYSIVQAENVDEVKEMVKDHPHLMMPGGASIDILELLQMQGM